MIHALRKEFVLAARNAAGRFAPRCAHHHAATRVTWRPLALRWQRKPRHSTQVVMARAANSAKLFWQPQIHLHLATSATERVQLEHPTTALRATTIYQTRLILSQHWLSARGVAKTLTPQRLRLPERVAQADRSARLLKQHWLSTHEVTSPLPPRGLRQLERMEQADKPAWLSKRMSAAIVAGDAVSQPAPVLAARIAPRFLSTRRAQPFEVLRPRERRVAPQNESLSSITHQGRVLSRQLQRITTSAPATDAYVLPRALKRRQQPIQLDRAVEPSLAFERAVELVWQQRPRTATVAAHEFAPEPLTTLPALATRTPSSTQLAQMNARARAEVARVSVTKLDPGLMDQLANDVIRRVEQRLRIERERRGL